jgi:PAT family beta-lactamase induction signal transducer AmpG
MGLFALLVALASASQDILVDAYRAEILKPEELGAGTGVAITGYRIAMIVSGAFALILADRFSWPVVYLLMAAAVSLGLVATLWADEPPEPRVEQNSVSALGRLRDGVMGPLLDFFGRQGAIEILIFLVLYKLGDVVAGAMITPFLLQTGFSKTDVGAVYKVFGMLATIGGSLLGGLILFRIGMRASLFLFGVLQAGTNVMFFLLAQAGVSYPLLVSTVVLENLAGGMGSSAYAAFMMVLCRKQFTASQYALLSSLMAVARVLAASPSGLLARELGWPVFFLVTVAFAVPSLAMLARFGYWERGIPQHDG